MLLISLLSGALPLIIGAIVIIIVVSRSGAGRSSAQTPEMSAWQLQQRNQEWIAFIEAYDQLATTPAEKQLIRHMLYDAAAQGLGTSVIGDQYLGKLAAAEVPSPSFEAAPADYPTPQYVPVAPPKPIDNAALLLYLGAFLFVASVGLFIAFGGANASLRTLAVVLVAAVMYGGGQWLYQRKPKLRAAGVAFVAIGIVMAPLVGLAFYAYIFHQRYGAVVWFLTSAACLLLYLHALLTLKKPLISYLLIFTFLSLFEAGISVAVAPVYYFGWGLALVGIILQLLSRRSGYYKELREPSRYSGMVLLPIAVVTALVMVGQQGSGQFGISLLLAAAFYGLEALETKGTERAVDAVVSQMTAVLASGSLLYSIKHDWLLVVVGVLVVNLAQVLALLYGNPASRLWRNFASVLVTLSVIDVLVAISHPASLGAVTGGLTAIALLIWWRQRRADAYGLAVLAFAALPYLYGQLNMRPSLSLSQQTTVSFVTLLLILAAYFGLHKRQRSVDDWKTYAQVGYTVAALSVLVTSALAGPLYCLLAAIGIAGSFLAFAEHDKQHDWAEVAAVVLMVPVFRGWSDQPVLLASLLAALLIFIATSLRYRSEFLRWSSTVIWLALPLGLGRGVFGTEWSATAYAWSYIGVMAALILSRAIARGVVLFSAKTPLAAYTRSASLSYVAGYVSAATLAVFTSLAATDSRLHTTIILLVVMSTVALAGPLIEKRRDVLALLPLLAQAALLSGIRPAAQGASLTTFLLVSTGLAVLCYALPDPRKLSKPASPSRLFSEAAIVAAFVAPTAILFGGHDTWPMPLGLLVAGTLLTYHLRQAQQTVRELAGTAVTLSVLWFLGTWHVHYLQAYVHVIVANLGLYAYWRTRRHETAAADGYLWALLATATVPLALQALAGVAGGLYGWWLLLEQVALMLLGMTIRKRYVVFWGLYTAVAAVIFQLRHLGWAALIVLAVFLIGLALYQLQRHSEQN